MEKESLGEFGVMVVTSTTTWGTRAGCNVIYRCARWQHVFASVQERLAKNLGIVENLSGAKAGRPPILDSVRPRAHKIYPAERK